MKGLWIKDWLFLKSQWLAAALTLVLAFGALMIFREIGIAVGMGIASLTATFVMLATVSADQANHGIRFLLTLPITAAQYARQKFALLASVIAATTLAMTGMALAYRAYRNWQLSAATTVAFVVSVGLIIFCLLGLSLAFQLKNGAEKAQVAMSMLGGVVALLLGGGFMAVQHSAWGLHWWLNIVSDYTQHGGVVTMAVLGLVALMIGVGGSLYARHLAH